MINILTALLLTIPYGLLSVFFSFGHETTAIIMLMVYFSSFLGFELIDIKRLIESKEFKKNG